MVWFLEIVSPILIKLWNEFKQTILLVILLYIFVPIFPWIKSFQSSSQLNPNVYGKILNFILSGFNPNNTAPLTTAISGRDGIKCIS